MTELSEKEKEIINNMREFLHGISNKMTIADGMTDAVFNTLKTRKDVDSSILVRLEKALNALKIISEMIREERTKLVAFDAGRIDKL